MRYATRYLGRGASHPLLRQWSDGVSEHRIALFDAIGPGTHLCHWCLTPVAWHPMFGEEPLVTDHLDDNGLNNVPENLVAACSRCNTWRGRWPESFERFIAEHTQAAS